ncbi:hypothetical protein CHU95_13160 [Niveispirillum lacus]|uniref:Uncharacterized protein n=2 Tax=Niveispirillum lacus TaxID=1981099 RepID=A0A255YW10_9PROT|nr:hypothetical protein CHU95_13160 [Niveispirillum lacus]
MDLVAWTAILSDRRRRGLWQRTERFSNRERDWILVWLPSLAEPSLRLERDSQGVYRLSYFDGQAWFQFRQGPDILDCLAQMEPTPPLTAIVRKVE